MKKYENPVVVNVGASEGIYMASGTKALCRFQREGYNAGADTCQSCSATNGENGTGKHADTGKQYYKEDFKGCPDNMPPSDKK